MAERSIRDLAWLAGLFEGEGSITTATKRNPLRLSMTSTDEDVIRRAAEIAGVGTVNGPYAPGTNEHGKKPYWKWSVHRKAEAAGLLMTMFPLLGERRRKRATEALLEWRGAWGYGHHLCKNELHPRPPDGGKCPECKAATAREYHQANRDARLAYLRDYHRKRKAA